MTDRNNASIAESPNPADERHAQLVALIPEAFTEGTIVSFHRLSGVQHTVGKPRAHPTFQFAELLTGVPRSTENRRAARA
jgi:hypothetical protein